MSFRTTFADFASVAKDYGYQLAASVKEGAQSAYQEMTVEKARLVLKTAEEYGTNVYNSITIENARAKLNDVGITFNEYKGYYIELINKDNQFAVANVAMVNVAAFFVFDALTTRIGQMVNCTRRPIHLIKEFALNAGFGYGIYKTNALFCQVTGFAMHNQTMKTLAIGALIVRIVKQYTPEMTQKFNNLSRKIDFFNLVKASSQDVSAFRVILQNQIEAMRDATRTALVNLYNGINADLVALKGKCAALEKQQAVLQAQVQKLLDEQEAKKKEMLSYMG